MEKEKGNLGGSAPKPRGQYLDSRQFPYKELGYLEKSGYFEEHQKNSGKVLARNVQRMPPSLTDNTWTAVSSLARGCGCTGESKKTKMF